MRSSFTFAIAALILTACSQTSITSIPLPTATPTPPPTATPIPTPTLQPAFVALQDQIAAMGERFTLQADGRLWDGETKNAIDGLRASPSGEMTLTLADGTVVTLDPTQAIYDDENGFSYPGYVQDEAGEWVEARPIKEFPWCKDMYKFEECVIDQADLQEHGRFAQSTLTEDLFNPELLNFAPMTPMSVTYGEDGMYLIPNIETAPNYKNEATAPFKTDYMFGMTSIGGVDHYVIQVPYYVEGVDTKDWPVITGVWRVSQGAYKLYNVGIFLDRMNVVPWNISDLNIATQYTNPKTGVNFTLEEVQAIVEEMKVGNFANTNGLVLNFQIARNSGGWYE